MKKILGTKESRKSKVIWTSKKLVKMPYITSTPKMCQPMVQYPTDIGILHKEVGLLLQEMSKLVDKGIQDCVSVL